MRHTAPILSARGIEGGYGDMQILHGLSAHISKGEIVVIIGPNGCGKSTFLKALTGLIMPSAGTITLDSTDVTKSTPRQRLKMGLGYVPQVQNVFATMSTKDNLRMGLHATGGDFAVRSEAVRTILPTLEQFWHKAAGDLSGGQQQIVALGRALMPQPRVLLLDEPSAGLSPIATDGVFQHIRNIADRSDVGVLLVEQNAHKALAIADRCYVIAEGLNKAEGTATEILGNAEVGRIYLGAAN